VGLPLPFAHVDAVVLVREQRFAKGFPRVNVQQFYQ
jgi:hypothetical protein